MAGEGGQKYRRSEKEGENWKDTVEELIVVAQFVEMTEEIEDWEEIVKEST